MDIYSTPEEASESFSRIKRNLSFPRVPLSLLSRDQRYCVLTPLLPGVARKIKCPPSATPSERD
jgi:hypothetical protein